MEKKYDEINIEDIRAIETGIRMMYDSEEDRKRKEIIEDKRQGVSIPKDALQKNQEKYGRIKENDPILKVSKKLAEMKKVADKKHKADGLYHLIKDTDNAKSTKLIESVIKDYYKENSKIYNQANMIMSEGKIKRPNPGLEEMDLIKYVNITDEGFDIDMGYQDGKDGYPEIFRAALDNQNNDIYKSDYEIEPEVDPMSYVEEKLEDIRKIEDFWEADKFKEYIDTLEEQDHKKAQKYKSAHLKKMQEMRKLAKLYEELAQVKDSSKKIQKALNELRAQRANMPDKVYNKIEKSLEKQKNKVDKRIQKVQKKANNVIENGGIRDSINNAKQYDDVAKELEGITRQEMFEEELARMNIALKEAEIKLQQEYDKSKMIPEEEKVQVIGGDAYGTGEINPSSRTNIEAINEAKRKVLEIKQQISKTEEMRQQNAAKREMLEKRIQNISKAEVQSTIKKTRPDNKLLGEGNYALEEKINNSNKRDISFAQPYAGIDHEKANRNVEENQNNNREDKKLEEYE